MTTGSVQGTRDACCTMLVYVMGFASLLTCCVAAWQIYERYLETVVEASGGDFDEIEDALKRFATLQVLVWA